MSGRHDDDIQGDEQLTAEQLRVQAAVRSLRVPEADPDFRSRLREQFVRGDFPSEESGLAAGDRVVPLDRARRLRRYGIPLSLAAALVLMFGLLDQGPDWDVVGVGEEMQHVLVDGELVPCDELGLLQAALHPGCTVRVPEGGRLEIVASGTLLLELDGSVEMDLPSTPGRWVGRDVESRVSGQGTLRVATGPRFDGARYRLHSGGATFDVAGTTFAIEQRGTETCLCVLDGEVEVTTPDGERHEVGAGRRVTFDENEASVDTGAMLPTEFEALSRLRERADRLG